MSRYSIISFDTDEIRVVRAECGNDRVVVKNTSRITEADLEALLRTGSEDNFVVVANIKELYQEVLFLPNVEANLFQSLIFNEICKNRPDLRDFTFIYRLIGDSFHEGKLYKKIAVFAYANSDIAPVIDRFVRWNKTVRFLYPSSFALSRLQQTDPTPAAENVLCIADQRKEKLAFLMQNNQLYFTRTIQSNGAGFTETDVQNINMTIDYCLQSLRIKPELAVLVNSACDLTTPPFRVMIPTSSLKHFAEFGASPDVVREYCLAIGALLCLKSAEEGNILPREHRKFFSQKAAYRYSIGAMLVVSVITLAAIAFSAMNIFGLNDQITLLRGTIRSHGPERAAYVKATGEMTKMMPFLTFINKAAAQPDLQKPLIALQSLNNQRDVELTAITLNAAEGTSLSLVINGKIISKGMGDAQAALDHLVKTFRESSGMEVLGQKLEVTQRTFSINAQQKKL